MVHLDDTCVIHAHQQGPARSKGTCDLQNFSSLWMDGEYEEIPFESNTGSGIHIRSLTMTFNLPSEKGERFSREQ